MRCYSPKSRTSSCRDKQCESYLNFPTRVLGERLLLTAPRKRFAHPGEIANAIFFLNSDEASFCTGTVMRVDAGWGAK